MTSFLRRRRREIVDGVTRLWWIFVIVGPLCFLVGWLAIDHANANQARALKASDQKFRQAVKISDDKHQQALHSQAVLFAYSINKSVCVLRVIATQQIARLETTKPQGYKDAEGFWLRVVDNQVPIPASLDCSTLPKKPPKGTP